MSEGKMLLQAKVAYVDAGHVPSCVARAQVAATLAVAEEVALLREALPGALLEGLGDDSHLDRLVQVLRTCLSEFRA